MKRRDFICKSGCSVAGLMAAPMMFDSAALAGQEKRKKYKIDIEIYEALENTWCHKKGEKFAYDAFLVANGKYKDLPVQGKAISLHELRSK